jgi:hypothetical protein
VHKPAGAVLTDWELDTPFSLPRCRCTSLQELCVKRREEGIEVTFSLLGQGASAEQRRRSLQHDLAALTACPFMADYAVWPHLQCLTSACLRGDSVPFHDSQPAWYTQALRAALSATSLVELKVELEAPFEPPPAAHPPLLAHLSNLRSLTHLTLWNVDFRVPVCSAALQEGLLPLSRLQQLSLAALRGADGALAPLHLHLPTSQLPRLTSVRLRGCPLDSGQPVELGAVQELELDWCRMGSLEALSACPHLTRLVHRLGNSVNCTGCDFPAGWKEGLRSLEWHECNAGTLAWVEQLRGLTTLNLYEVSMTPAFFRCAHEVSQLAQETLAALIMFTLPDCDCAI